MMHRDLGIDFLRFLAIILVINSHMDAFYPMSHFATGGAFGNALFFMLSSFGLYHSQKRAPENFWNYLKKRVVRIYPVVWVTMAVLILPMILFYLLTNPAMVEVIAHEFKLTGILDFFSIVFYPPPAFWFLQALMIYYVVGYFYICFFSNRSKILLIAILLFTYIFLYLRIDNFSTLVIEQEIEFKFIFYFLIFIMGAELAVRNLQNSRTRWYDFIIIIFLLLLLYGHKIIAAKGIFPEWQFIQQLVMFPIVYFMLRISRSTIVSSIMTTPWLNRFISLSAVMTLELYLVHGPLREVMLPYLGVFPFNVLIYLPVVFAMAYLVYRISRKVIESFNSLLV